MGKVNVIHQAFNVGVRDKKHLARVDLETNRLAAETQNNILPLTTGPGIPRPGLQFIASMLTSEAMIEPFIFGATDACLMIFQNQSMKIMVDDNLVIRPAVTAAITNGTFAAGAGWTLAPTTGATTTVSGGYLNLTATAKGSLALAKQQVTVNEQNVEHGLRITVERGPVTFRCGSTEGGDEYITETTLRTGTHSLAFTPTTASFWVQFQSDLPVLKRVDSIVVESAGTMTLSTPWTLADLDLMRFAQSADVVFVTARGYQQRRIERRSSRSWSIVLYQVDDGPFTVGRTASVRLRPSVLTGNGTLTADKAFFTADHVGTLFRLFHSGQSVQQDLAGESQFSDPIRVTGLYSGGASTERSYTWTISGVWVGTISRERSSDGGDFGFGILSTTAVNTGPTTSNDTVDNAIYYYRWGFRGGSYTSGTATVTVTYNGGGGFGICRVVGFTSSTVVDIEVLTPFKGTDYTEDWREGEWSAAQIWPSAVALTDGRLWQSGEDRIWGSVSDAFESMDEEFEGDAGPISRSIGTNGINDTNWLLPLARLIAGTEGATTTMKSSSLDEPVTPTNLSMKDSSTVGVAPVDPIRVDGRAYFVDRSGTGLFEIVFDGSSGDFIVTQINKLTTELFSSGIRAMAVQRRPDTRIWIVMEDGTLACMVIEPLEEVFAIVPIETDGLVKSVAVLPDDTQDRPYFVVARDVGASVIATAYYIEKMALDSEVRPSTLCKVMDSFKSGTNIVAATTFTPGPHLAGKQVVVWADGAPLVTNSDNSQTIRTYTANALGQITVESAVTDWVAGLPYDCEYKSARLAYGAEGGTAVLQKKKIESLGLIMTDFVRFGVKFGKDFDNLKPLPVNKDGTAAEQIVLSDLSEEEPFVFNGEWSTDSRVHIKWSSPNTATLLGLVIGVQTNER